MIDSQVRPVVDLVREHVEGVVRRFHAVIAQTMTAPLAQASDVHSVDELTEALMDRPESERIADQAHRQLYLHLPADVADAPGVLRGCCAILTLETYAVLRDLSESGNAAGADAALLALIERYADLFTCKIMLV